MIYLDNAATSFVKPKQVKLSVVEALNKYTANPGRSGHFLSQVVAEKVFDARESIKEFFCAQNYKLIFTKNCTEALNLAIFGMLKKGDHVIATCYEHNSVLRPLEELKNKGVEVTIMDCDMCDIEKNLKSKIKLNTKMVITTMVSNVTGEVCDVQAVSNICKEYKIIYLVDGAQASGHMLVNLQSLDVDMYAFAGHKGLLSITGVGGLFVKNGISLKPILYGGTGTSSESLIQPTEFVEGFESGTIPSVSIISLGAGVEFLKKNFFKILEKEQKLNDYLYKKLKNVKNLTLFSKKSSKNVFSFNVLNYDSMQVADYLNEKFGICARAGLHCAPLVHKKLGTLKSGAVRVSIDFNNSYQEIDYLIAALNQISSL